MDPFTMMAIGGAVYGLNNAMSEVHARNAFGREKQLMDKQNQINKANALDAYRTQVEGAKMAGLNPSMMQSVTPIAPEVSKGQAPKGENVEFNPSDVLMLAQAENVQADTKLKNVEANKMAGVDTENTKADTALKTANRLLAGAERGKVEEEAQRIRNLNQAFDAENDMLATTGQVMAEKWQSQPWYSALAPDTKATIDSIADGSLPLSVGGMSALERVIASQKNLSDADRALVKNAFDNVITDAMLKDKKVMEALTKLPDTEKRKAEAQIRDLVASARHHNIQAKWQEKEFKSKEFNDPNWTWENFWSNPSLKNFGIWLQASYSDKLNSLRETAQQAAAHAAGGAALGKFGGSAASRGVRDVYDRGRANGVGDVFERSHRTPFSSYNSNYWFNRGSQGVQDMFGNSDW